MGGTRIDGKPGAFTLSGIRMEMPMSGAGLTDLSTGPSSTIVEALVEAGGVETRYCRAGRGTPVLLVARAGVEVRGSRTFAELARHGCVIAPEPPDPATTGAGGGPPRIADWLRDVIDGLGLERPSLVVDEPFGLDALEFVVTDGERVRDLVVLRSAPGGPERGRPPSDAAFEHFECRILLLEGAATAGGGTPAQERLSELIRFLSPEAPPS